MSEQPATLGELLTLSWEEYKKRALPILAVMLISTVIIGFLTIILALCVGFGGALFAHTEVYRDWVLVLIAAGGLLFIVMTVLGLWFYTALLAIIVDEELGILEAFRSGWRNFWPMTWVITIFTGMIVTGFIFGILPAILAWVWFSFSFYILLAEDRRGMDALLASMEYVRGDWWNTFGKLLFIWLISMLIGIIPFIGTLLSILFYPYLLLYMVAIYRDLKSRKGEIELLVSSGARILWWGIAAIGLVVPVIALIGMLIALLSGETMWFEEIRQTMHGQAV